MDNNALDFLRNRNPDRRLGPFDGRVAAFVKIQGETFLVTTNTTYVPEPVITKKVFIRDNMRYGVDDYTLWPQKFTQKHPHLAAIPRLAQRPDLQVMWWEPTRADFVAGSTITRGLGKLCSEKLREMTDKVQSLIVRYNDYKKSIFPRTPPETHDQVLQGMILALERLELLPTTYDKMRFGVATLQTHYLEMEGLVDWMTVYVPMVNTLSAQRSAADPAPCMGTFVHEPVIAQQLHKMGLPFWFLRPSHQFDTENILKLVDLTRPSLFLSAECPPDIVPVYSGSNVEEKIAAMTKEAQKMAWCPDPFADPPTGRWSAGVEHGTSFPASSSSSSASRVHSATSQGASAGVQRTRVPPRSTPYQRPARGRAATGSAIKAPVQSERDKFKPLVADEMPGYLSCWTKALAQVDRNVDVISGSPQDKYYVLPEPALLASPKSPERRQMFLHNWTLVHAAMIYRATEGNGCLSSQEWRDILEGKAMREDGQRNKRTGNNRSLRDIMAPVLADCGIEDLNGYPVPREAILPEYSILAAKQIIWQVAETNFRFEFVSLDQRASGRERKRAVAKCFAGGMFFEVPLKYSKQGLAAVHLRDRHPYYIRMAFLMLDWTVPCRRPTAIKNMPAREEERRVWKEDEMRDLEFGVARYYTQAFFELYGRPAVLPMWLGHDFVETPIPHNITEIDGGAQN
ncbi:hypothetical protein K438DRAFT_1752328 [Mycena galopus ATCC 62051]|nr:hypothetical protein K438DRAFT_1752328 [Mycena galopus ATCC 62051]